MNTADYKSDPPTCRIANPTGHKTMARSLFRSGGFETRPHYCEKKKTKASIILPN